MIMDAAVIEVQRDRLLVLDLETRQTVLVNTANARDYNPGELVLIWYNGVMTSSIPPQITAQRIAPMPPGAIPTYPPDCTPFGCVRPPIFIPIIRPPFGPPGNRPWHRR